MLADLWEELELKLVFRGVIESVSSGETIGALEGLLKLAFGTILMDDDVLKDGCMILTFIKMV